MHSRILLISLVFILCFALVKIQAQEKTAERVDPKTAAPVVETWEPKTGSINSYIDLTGYRLYPGDSNKAKAFFIQNGVEIPARTAGGSSTTNDEHEGQQTLGVIVPEGVVLGQGSDYR